MLTTHYLAIKLLHIALVLASGALFVARGGGVLAGQAWPMVPLVRRLSVLIDVALLTAGVTLWLLLSWHPLLHPWLGTKLALLLLYIVLGSLALKRAPRRGQRALCFVAALLVYGFMVSVAVTHQPWGILAGWLG